MDSIFYVRYMLKISYCKYEPMHYFTSCCYAPLCQECSIYRNIACIFCSPGKYIKTPWSFSKTQFGTEGWMKWFQLFDEYNEALTLMPNFVIFLRSSCLVPKRWNDVNTRETYMMYKSFFNQLEKVMVLNLWNVFASFSKDSFPVIGRDVRRLDYLPNESPQSKWDPTMCIVNRARFGLISRIAIKIATGPFQARLTDKSTRKIYRLLMRRILSFQE